MSRYQIGMSRYHIGMSRYQIDMSRYKIGTSSYQIDMSRYQIGMSMYQIGMSRYKIGMSSRSRCYFDRYVRGFPLFLELKFGTPAQIKSVSLTSNSIPTCRSVIIENLAPPPLKQNSIPRSWKSPTHHLI
jgi:hypothetical protein